MNEIVSIQYQIHIVIYINLEYIRQKSILCADL